MLCVSVRVRVAFTERELDSQCLIPSLHATDTVKTKTRYKLMVGQQRYNTWSSAMWPPDFLCTDRNSSAPLECGAPTKGQETWGCLFNVHRDPNERTDLAKDPAFHEVLVSMQQRLVSMQGNVWHNCDPPSVCNSMTPIDYCEHIHKSCGDVYCPVFDTTSLTTAPYSKNR